MGPAASRGKLRWSMNRAIAALALLVASCSEPAPSAPERPSEVLPPALGPAPADGFYRVTWTRDATGARPVHEGYGGRAFARVGEPVDGLVEARMWSQDNDNASYSLFAYFGRARCGEVALVVGGDVIRDTGGGSEGPERCLVSYAIDRAHADGAARVAGTERGDRVELGASLQARLALQRTVIAPGDPVLVSLDVTNPEGAEPVQVSVVTDARLRRVEVLATRGDALVSREEGPGGFSIRGGSHWERLGPGQSATRQSFSLADRIDTSERGDYRVTVRTWLELAAPDVDADENEAPHRRWAREVRGVFELEVR